MAEQITVLGAGVIGLTTAQALLEAGHDVRVVAAAWGDAITSAAAGAIWLPFRASPPDKVNRWAAQTREWEANLARERPESGVAVVWQEVYTQTSERPWWADSVSDLGPPETGRAEAPYIWGFHAPRIEPSVFCPWLIRECNITIEQRKFESLADVPGDIVINCTGLGAKGLTGDTQLSGVWGQTTIVEGGNINLHHSISDERDTNEFFYSIPRANQMVLGGCAIPQQGERDPKTGGEIASPPTAQWRATILERARVHGIVPDRVIRDSSGLRPFRASVRVEPDAADSRIIHNYGHGGAGYTLCRGCAIEVVQLVAGAVRTA
jgi:D-amino-acid oxidase